MSTHHKCSCTNCGNKCADKKTTATPAPKPPEEIPTGFLARRPWIWILVGYFAMVSALCTMVVIAVKHQQPDVPVTHGH